MFHKTSIRLAGIYLAIIIAISLFFSLSVYRLSTQEFDRGFRHQEALFENLPPVGSFLNVRDQFVAQRERDISDAKSHIIARLVLVNMFILISGGLLSYYLARRSLRPIEEAHDAQSRFTADASHELRTPIAAMQAEIEVALMKPDLTLNEAKQQLTSNLEELHKLTNLTENLLRLARLEHGSLVRSRVLVGSIVMSGITRVSSQAEAKHTLIKTRIDDDVFVVGDDAALIEVLVTLLDNAVKYSPRKSEILVMVKKEPRHAVIQVKDRGIGIKATEQPHIFERFYRADSARSKDKVDGYGLGLAIAKTIIDLHEGDVAVRSVPAKGTTFTIHLPLA